MNLELAALRQTRKSEILFFKPVGPVDGTSVVRPHMYQSVEGIGSPNVAMIMPSPASVARGSVTRLCTSVERLGSAVWEK